MGGLYIKLPNFIKNKKACVNIKNNDNKCFLWCLLASRHYNVDVTVDSKIKEPENVSYPIEIDTVSEFEN